MNANHVNVAPLVFTVFAALVVSCAAGTDGVDKLILPTPVSVEVKQGAVSQDALSRVVTINVHIGKDKLNMVERSGLPYDKKKISV